MGRNTNTTGGGGQRFRTVCFANFARLWPRQAGASLGEYKLPSERDAKAEVERPDRFVFP